MTENRWASSEAGAIQALEAFMAALNTGDQKALFDTMHVPHVRISGNGVAIYATREDLEKDYLEGFAAREWLEEYGIFPDDLTELVVAEDGRGNTLLLFAGELDFEGIRDDLDDAGFRDSIYRNVEVWEQRRGDLVVALLEGRQGRLC